MKCVFLSGVLAFAVTAPVVVGGEEAPGSARLASCLPPAPRPAEHPGIQLPFHLHPRNYPVLAIGAEIESIGRRVVARDVPALCRNNIAMRRLLTVEEDYADSLNSWLDGNTPSLLTGLGGLFIGAVDPLAGAFSQVLTAAVDRARHQPGFRVREGDEIWRVDLAASDRGRPVYIVYTVLHDPFRDTQWLMHEQRRPLIDKGGPSSEGSRREGGSAGGGTTDDDEDDEFEIDIDLTDLEG